MEFGHSTLILSHLLVDSDLFYIILIGFMLILTCFMLILTHFMLILMFYVDLL